MLNGPNDHNPNVIGLLRADCSNLIGHSSPRTNDNCWHSISEFLYCYLHAFTHFSFANPFELQSPSLAGMPSVIKVTRPLRADIGDQPTPQPDVAPSKPIVPVRTMAEVYATPLTPKVAIGERVETPPHTTSTEVRLPD
jgi:hypothetical protein